jgi:hypothetical protein
MWNKYLNFEGEQIIICNPEDIGSDQSVRIGGKRAFGTHFVRIL